MFTPRTPTRRRLFLLLAALHWLAGCYTYRTVAQPRTQTRPIAPLTRVTLLDGTHYTVVGAHRTAHGIVFSADRLVPWDSVARFEERRISVVRTIALATALAIGAAIVVDGMIAVYDFASLFETSSPAP